MSNTDRIRIPLAQIIPPILMIVVGLVLMAIMIVVESEPGGIPILLVAAGTVWYFVVRSRASK